MGGPSFLIDTGKTTLLVDPVLGSGQGFDRLTPTPNIDLGHVDALVLTQASTDHVDGDALARLPKTIVCLVPPGGSERMRNAGFENVTPLAPGQSQSIGETEIIVVAGGIGNEPATNGYLLRLADGDSIMAYITGDTLFTDSIREVQQKFGYVDVLVPYLGAQGAPEIVSSDAKDAMQFVYRMRPRRIVPVHHSTFSLYTEPIETFKEKIDLTIYEKKLTILEEGETFES